MNIKIQTKLMRKKFPQAYKAMYSRVYARGYYTGKQLNKPKPVIAVDSKGEKRKLFPSFISRFISA
jgi:hypothetical protein